MKKKKKRKKKDMFTIHITKEARRQFLDVLIEEEVTSFLSILKCYNYFIWQHTLVDLQKSRN